jgi:NADH-quinone oxidoreductase subunit C
MQNIQSIFTKLKDKFGPGIVTSDLSGDIASATVTVSVIYKVIEFLRDDPETGFQFLTDLCGIHYPDEKLQFGVIYHLHNLRENIRIRIKTFVSLSNLEVPTVTSLFESANWMERETYDFYGIIFTGHPNLKRILNVEYLDFFPMRKEYPLEDPTREDKDNRFFGR